MGNVWFVDETNIRECLGIGAICIVRLISKPQGKRDMVRTKALSEKAREISAESPKQVFTDGLTSYSRAIDKELGKEVENHQIIGCQGNPVEQSHYSQKYRYYPES